MRNLAPVINTDDLPTKAAVDAKLPLAGGTLTGNLTVQGDTSTDWLASKYGGDFGGFRVNSVATPVDPTDVANKAYVDSKGGLDQTTADTRYVNVSGDTMTGALGMDSAAGVGIGMAFQSTGSWRWTFGKNATPEGGSNSGSHFTIGRYSDAGGWIDDPLSINRTTGVVSVAKAPVGAQDVVTKAYADALTAIGASTPTDPACEVWLDTGSSLGGITVVSPPATASVIASTSALTSSSGNTTVTTTIPAGGQTGDTLLLMLFSTDTASGGVITPTTTGWTVQNAIADQGTCQRAFYTAPWSAGLAGVTWTCAANKRYGFVCVLVRNGRTPVIALTDLSASGTVLTAPAATATGAGLALRFFCRKDSLSTSQTFSGSSTSIVNLMGTVGPAPHVGCFSNVQAAAGTTGTATDTFTVASANGSSWTVAV